MTCRHQGFRAVSSSYDRTRGLLVYFWTCERCGARLNEAGRTEYRPRFDPQGNQRFLASAPETPAA
jgi:hypothetical protein